MEGRFMARDGSARTPDIPYCNKKLCFAATDLHFLAQLLHELSEHPKAFCTIQDDDFTMPWRDAVKNWNKENSS